MYGRGLDNVNISLYIYDIYVVDLSLCVHWDVCRHVFQEWKMDIHPDIEK